MTNKQTLKVDQMLPLGFGLVFLLVIFVAIFTTLKTKTLVETTRWVAHTYKVQSDLKELEKTLVDAETGERGFLLTGNKNFLEPYYTSEQKIQSIFDGLTDQIQDNSAQIERLAALESIAQQMLNQLQETIILQQSGKDKAAIAIVASGEGKQMMDEVRRRIAEMNSVENELLSKRQQEAKQAEKLSVFVSIGGTVLVILCGCYIAYFLTRNITKLIRQVQQSGIQVTVSATQIAASGKQLECSMTEQVASINEVVATAREIAATSSELASTMEEVAVTANATASATHSSQTDLVRMEATMRQLVDATHSISTKLEVINAKASNINNVVLTITKVADQTNLLSLNAAIEAEKAGEYGLGFAVVAREIRRLADQTAVATLDIEKMVKEMQSAVFTGVMEMDKFTQEVSGAVADVQNISIQQVQTIERVQLLNPSFGMVNQGMENQSQAAQQISEAMVQLSETATQTAQSLGEINHAIEQLNHAAQGLHLEITRFSSRDGSSGQIPPAPRTPASNWQPT